MVENELVKADRLRPNNHLASLLVVMVWEISGKTLDAKARVAMLPQPTISWVQTFRYINS